MKVIRKPTKRNFSVIRKPIIHKIVKKPFARKIVIEQMVYTYDELDDAAKETVREWYIRGQDTDLFTNDCLERLGIDYPNSDLNVEYSLSYSQGDGFNIYGDLALKDALNAINANSVEIQNFIGEYLDYNLPLAKNKSRYAYCWTEHSVENWIDKIKDNFEDEETYEEIEHTEEDKKMLKEACTVLEKIGNKIKQDCRDFEKYGYDYFYPDDEEIAEACEANEWEFDQDGHIV